MILYLQPKCICDVLFTCSQTDPLASLLAVVLWRTVLKSLLNICMLLCVRDAYSSQNICVTQLENNKVFFAPMLQRPLDRPVLTVTTMDFFLSPPKVLAQNALLITDDSCHHEQCTASQTGD